MSYPSILKQKAVRISDDLEKLGMEVFSDERILPGMNWKKALNEGLEASAAMLFIVDLNRPIGMSQKAELDRAMERGLPIVPVVVAGEEGLDGLPPTLASYQGADLRDAEYEENLRRLADGLKLVSALANPGETLVFVDPDDPEKGRWGGRAMANGRSLTASVEEIGSGWCTILLEVSFLNGSPPVEGEVVFHIYPSFPDPIRRVSARDGRAVLRMQGWGAFTVGVEVDRGRTTLELDLAQDPSLPEDFRAR